MTNRLEETFGRFSWCRIVENRSTPCFVLDMCQMLVVLNFSESWAI